MTTHRQKFLPTLLALSALGLSTAALWLLFAENGRELSTRAWTIGMGVGFGVSVVFTWGMVWFLTTIVDEDGIRGWSAWSTPRRMRWDEIAEGNVSKVPLVPFVRIQSSEGGVAIWQPLLLSDEARFTEAVAHAAGESHPLTRFLRDWSHPPA